MRDLLGGWAQHRDFPDHNPTRDDAPWSQAKVWCPHCHIHRVIEDHEGNEDV